MRKATGFPLPNGGNGIFSPVYDIETIDAELRLVAALRRAAWERCGPLPSIDVADALLDERQDGY